MILMSYNQQFLDVLCLLLRLMCMHVCMALEQSLTLTLRTVTEQVL